MRQHQAPRASRRGLRQLAKWSAGALALTALSAMTSAPASAHDLGVYGTVWPIAEQSLLVRMLEKAAHVNWKAVRHRLGHRADYQMHHFPQVTLRAAPLTVTH